MLPDRSPANAAFVARRASLFRISSKREGRRDNFSGRLEFRSSKRRPAEDRYGSRPATPVLRRAADCRRHLVMNSFRPTPTMAHVTIAVALVGAAITIGLTIWESQKGKTRGPVIIDDQFVSHRQR
jgi:hypothetical protein